VGYRRAFYPDADRDYGVLAFKGLAPYLFEMDADLFIGSSGQVGARLDAEYEYMFTQKLILSPEIEMNFYSKDDPEIGIGSGLANMELGLRLRYEIRREFAPYIGVNWSQKFGQTADYARDEDENSSDVRFVVGIRAWF
jgi:copper resistance protein B